MLEEVRSMVIMEAMNKNIKILIEIEGILENVSLFSDERRIKQVLINLFTNAIKFTFEGYVKLKVSSVPPEQNLLKFEMIDTGKGIRKEVIPLLMTPFATFDLPQQKINGGGIGLGLFICKTLVGVIGPESNLFIHSEEGKGTKVGFIAYVLMSKDEASLASMKSIFPISNYFDLELDVYQEEDVFPSDLRDVLIKKKNQVPLSIHLKSEFMDGVSSGEKLKLHDHCSINRALSFTGINLNSGKRNSKSGYLIKQNSNIEGGSTSKNMILNPPNSSNKSKYQQFLTLKSGEENLNSNNLSMRSNTVRENTHYVLIVDDSVYNLIMLGDMIKSYKEKNIQIEKANNGLAAVKMFSGRNSPFSNEPPYEIIFMDNEMPIMTGCEAGIMIKTKIYKEGFKDVKIICVSGDSIGGAQMGIDESFVKPILCENIFECLKKYL